MYFGPPWITWSNLEYIHPPIWLPVFIQRDSPGGPVGGGIPIRRSSVEIISSLNSFYRATLCQRGILAVVLCPSVRPSVPARCDFFVKSLLHFSEFHFIYHIIPVLRLLMEPFFIFFRRDLFLSFTFYHVSEMGQHGVRCEVGNRKKCSLCCLKVTV